MWDKFVILATALGFVIDALTVLAFLTSGASEVDIAIVGVEVTREGWGTLNIFLGVLIGGFVWSQTGSSMAGATVLGFFVFIAMILYDNVPGVTCTSAYILAPLAAITAISSKKFIKKE